MLIRQNLHIAHRRYLISQSKDSSDVYSDRSEVEQFKQQFVMCQFYTAMHTQPTSSALQLDSQCDSEWSRSQQKLSQQQLRQLRRKTKRLKKSVWEMDQNYIYITYLTHFANYLATSATRRITKVYRNMALLITTRSEKQAKSHHQKMMQKHGSVPNIVQSIQNDVMQHISVCPEFATRVQTINRIAQKFILKEQKRRSKLMQLRELNEVYSRIEKQGEEISDGIQIKLQKEGEIRLIQAEQSRKSGLEQMVAAGSAVS